MIRSIDDDLRLGAHSSYTGIGPQIVHIKWSTSKTYLSLHTSLGEVSGMPPDDPLLLDLAALGTSGPLQSFSTLGFPDVGYGVLQIQVS